MSDPTLSLLPALIAALRTSALVLAAFDDQALAVWSTPPNGGPDPTSEDYPFIRIGEIQVLSLERIETDVGGETTIDDPSEVFATIHAFSRPRDPLGQSGAPEAIRLLKAVRSTLADPDGITLAADEDGDSFRLVLSEIRDTRHFIDPDGVTAHSVLTARLELEPTET